MEGPAKLTQEQIEMNKQRAEETQKMISEGKSEVSINDAGEIVLLASESTIADARSEMAYALADKEFVEKYKDKIGANVHVEFSQRLVLNMNPVFDGMEETALAPIKLLVAAINSHKEIDAVLKEISSDGMVTLEFKGKNLRISRYDIKSIRS